MYQFYVVRYGGAVGSAAVICPWVGLQSISEHMNESQETANPGRSQR